MKLPYGRSHLSTSFSFEIRLRKYRIPHVYVKSIEIAVSQQSLFLNQNRLLAFCTLRCANSLFSLYSDFSVEFTLFFSLLLSASKLQIHTDSLLPILLERIKYQQRNFINLKFYFPVQIDSTSISPSFSTTAMPETAPSPFSTSKVAILSSTVRRIVLRISRAPLLP